ncbi:hypothetical protein [Mesonia maritima]|uniref:Hotdog family 3-hydroxylacyl-ACP dehydratase n=1 Tax=Mesonia maritima TaxID=1793873 RepID=A0ABU1K7T6_9FLAO|nr:hypothetical protein [Mesonia maritima]MDR6301674.1 putative hotdog family 3-hydroxylacyl-ACP dehydratase [Mesonia maritima]
MKLPIHTLEEIKKLIPQKEPFIMVSSLLSCSSEEGITALKIEPNNILVEENKFSEAGLLEYMAQSIALQSGFLAKQLTNGKPQIGYIVSIKSAEINKLPRVNSTITSTIKNLHEIAGIRDSVVTIKNEKEEIIARAEIKTYLVDHEG